jgi:hypothetical protein
MDIMEIRMVPLEHSTRILIKTDRVVEVISNSMITTRASMGIPNRGSKAILGFNNRILLDLFPNRTRIYLSVIWVIKFSKLKASKYLLNIRE